jgi:hypothetical protein
MYIDCVMYTVRGCGVCVALKKVISTVLTNPANSLIASQLQFHDVDVEEISELGHAEGVRPRMVPTLIAYKDGVATLGWEGFAAMQPTEIQESVVLDVLGQAAALADYVD